MDILNETDVINERIAKNLTYYRKLAGLTQAELAQKINYSDKSVSKWESANGVPDIYILLKLADLYGVTVNDLVSGEENRPAPKKPSKASSSLIMLLSSGIVWLVAIAFFVTMTLIVPHKPWWLVFLFALPADAIVVVVLSGVFKRKKTNFIAVTVLIWTAITFVYVLTSRFSNAEGLWTLYLLGIPVQVLLIFWNWFRGVKRKARRARKMQAEKPKDA